MSGIKLLLIIIISIQTYGKLIKRINSENSDFIDQAIPKVIEQLNENYEKTKRINALCLLQTYVNACPNTFSKYIEQVFKNLYNPLKDNNVYIIYYIAILLGSNKNISRRYAFRMS